MINNRAFLTAFAKVAELGTVHAAAASLGVTQTAVTARLKALEEELGVTLFLRSRRGMTLTEEGRVVQRYGVALAAVDAQFAAELRGGERAEVALTVVGPTSFVSTRLVDAATPLYTKFPFLSLHMRSFDQGGRLDLLRRGEADVAVVPPELVPHEMDSKRLRADRYVLVACAAWKGRRLSDLLSEERVIDFDERDTTTAGYLREFGLRAERPRLFVNENEALIRLFAEGVGFGTLTESVARPHLESGRLIALNRGQAVEEPLALAWYRRPQRTPYFEALIAAIR